MSLWDPVCQVPIEESEGDTFIITVELEYQCSLCVLSDSINSLIVIIQVLEILNSLF